MGERMFRKSQFTLAGKRIAEMDKANAAIKRITRRAPAPTEANKLIAEMKKRRAQLGVTANRMANHISKAQARMKNLSSAASASWSAYRVALAKSHKALARANRKTAKTIRRAVR